MTTSEIGRIRIANHIDKMHQILVEASPSLKIPSDTIDWMRETLHEAAQKEEVRARVNRLEMKLSCLEGQVTAMVSVPASVERLSRSSPRLVDELVEIIDARIALITGANE